MYVVQVGEAQVRKQSRLVFWTDPAYRTAEGLRTGIPVQAFGEIYGHTEIASGEGAQCHGAAFLVGARVVRACTDTAAPRARAG